MRTSQISSRSAAVAGSFSPGMAARRVSSTSAAEETASRSRASTSTWTPSWYTLPTESPSLLPRASAIVLAIAADFAPLGYSSSNEPSRVSRMETLVPRSCVVSPQERTERTVSAKVFPSPGLIRIAGGFFATLVSLVGALGQEGGIRVPWLSWFFSVFW